MPLYDPDTKGTPPDAGGAEVDGTEVETGLPVGREGCVGVAVGIGVGVGTGDDFL